MNVNVGESGAGEQSNENRSGDASAWNKNHTGQSNEQFQKGVGGDATTGDATTGGGSGDATSGKAVGGDVSADAGGVEHQHDVADRDGRVEGDPGRAGERVRAGLCREALPTRRCRAVEHEPFG